MESILGWQIWIFGTKGENKEIHSSPATDHGFLLDIGCLSASPIGNLTYFVAWVFGMNCILFGIWHDRAFS